jgi:hypothetical protein
LFDYKAITTPYNTDNMGKLFPAFSKKAGQVVTLFAFAPAPKIVLEWYMHPDTHLRSASVGKARICMQYKSCTVTGFWLRDSLYRDTAPVPATIILYRDSLPAPIKLVPPLLLYKSGAGVTRVILYKICTRTAKSAPYPPCTVTSFWLKYQHSARCLRRVTATAAGRLLR